MGLLRKVNQISGPSGLVLALIGIGLSIYFYIGSNKFRDPIFLIQSNDGVFASPVDDLENYLRVVRNSDGSEINGGIFRLEAVFWNRGSESIKPHHILIPLVLTFEKPVEIVDLQVTNETRPNVINTKIRRSADSSGMTLDFDILEQNDGFKIVINYIAESKVPLSILGEIEGVKSINSTGKLGVVHYVLGFAKAVLIFFAFFGAFALLDLIQRLTVRFVSEETRALTSKIIGNMFALLFLLFVLGMITAAIWVFAESSFKSSVPEMFESQKNQVTNDGVRS